MDKNKLMMGIGFGLIAAVVIFLIRSPDAVTGSVVLSDELSGELCPSRVMQVLSKIDDPERDAPLAEVIGMKTDDITVEGGKVTVVINLPSYCPFKKEITSTIKEEVGKMDGVESVEVRLKSELEAEPDASLGESAEQRQLAEDADIMLERGFTEEAAQTLYK